MPLGIAAGGEPKDAPAGARAGAAGERREAPVPPARAPAGPAAPPPGFAAEEATVPPRPEGPTMRRPKSK